ncbi:D-alanyl-D-alanine carboxypeptidase family protein [Paenibacillus daejeonensis]|uniref:D-alanyl-D-alanine carboxypeptidase family protein n=1 Tax=Paenibacillus daejeonensis TaxID=135193 RepID=UPI000373410A|nr:D-alanyl-D-alanine carboxypeptidase family protein [Paenibacillus daejeonensis]
MLKRLLLIVIAICAAWPVLPAVYPVYGAAPAISTHAHAAAVIDVQSGRILYSQRGDEPNKIASLTKIMTAIVAIEHGNLADIVKAGKGAVGKEGSSIYLQLNEEMSLHHLLYGLMLRSGNDAATAIAEHVGGSEAGFVHLMNEKATWLGLEQSHFMNPHGLDHPEHYSSANDLAKLTAYALRNSVFQEIVKTRIKKVPNPHDPWDYTWTNKNKMLAMYEGADGVKTGYTKQALRCLVSSATREGQQIAVVTLNDGDDWADHRKLLDWAFEHYPSADLIRIGQKVTGHPYVALGTLRYPMAVGEQASVKAKLVATDPTSIDYALGHRGRLEYYMEEDLIGAVPLKESPPPESRASGSRTTDAAQTVSSSRQQTESFMFSLYRVLLSVFGAGGERW